MVYRQEIIKNKCLQLCVIWSKCVRFLIFLYPTFCLHNLYCKYCQYTHTGLAGCKGIHRPLSLPGLGGQCCVQHERIIQTFSRYLKWTLTEHCFKVQILWHNVNYHWFWFWWKKINIKKHETICKNKNQLYFKPCCVLGLRCKALLNSSWLFKSICYLIVYLHSLSFFPLMC